MISEALTRSFEKFRFGNASSHAKNLWVVALKFSTLLWLVKLRLHSQETLLIKNRA